MTLRDPDLLPGGAGSGGNDFQGSMYCTCASVRARARVGVVDTVRWKGNFVASASFLPSAAHPLRSITRAPRYRSTARLDSICLLGDEIWYRRPRAQASFDRSYVHR